MALLIYKIGINWVNWFFEWANVFSYELYLVNSLVFAVMAFILKGIIPLYVEIVISLIVAYIVGYGYSCLLKIIRLK